MKKLLLKMQFLVIILSIITFSCLHVCSFQVFSFNGAVGSSVRGLRNSKLFISHGKTAFNKLSLPADQRKALLRALTTEVIRHGRIKTTLARGREASKWVDRMISLAKKGQHRHRVQAMAWLYDKSLVNPLFEQVPVRYGDRKGGYTRVIRLLERRRGDHAKMCVLELV
jgi:large subunit ribosomal protein L17